MKQVRKMLCQFLIVLMAWTPFQLSHAGMIETGEQVAVNNVAADRNTIIAMVDRQDVARELQSFGVDPFAAHQRIAALSDEEVVSLKGQLDSAPAGAGSGFVILVLVGVILWLVFYKRV